MTTTTHVTSALPILLNISSRAGYGVEWMMPGTGGTAMQLVNPRGTHYLLYALRPAYTADWLTMGVLKPHRFGIRGPLTSFDAFLPVAHAFIAAVTEATGTTGTTTDAAGYPRIPVPRDPNESYRRQARTQAASPRRPVTSLVTWLRERRRPGGRHRLLKHWGRTYRPTAPLGRPALYATTV